MGGGSLLQCSRHQSALQARLQHPPCMAPSPVPTAPRSLSHTRGHTRTQALSPEQPLHCFLLNDCMTSAPAYGHLLGTVTSPMAPNKLCPSPGPSWTEALPSSREGSIQLCPCELPGQRGKCREQGGLWNPRVLPVWILRAYFAVVVFTKTCEICCPNPLRKASCLQSFLPFPGSLHSDSNGRTRRGPEVKHCTLLWTLGRKCWRGRGIADQLLLLSCPASALSLVF